MSRSLIVVVALIVAFTASSAQNPVSYGRATEHVVIEYEQLVATGAFLTSEGWKKAARLYHEAQPFSADREILLMTIGGAVGENWRKENQAEVETKWTDFLGTIDSSLRYKPPQTDVPVSMTSFQFRLIYTNQHQEIAADGHSTRETSGSWEWKIEGPMIRCATVNRAIEYVSVMRARSQDPQIRKNADRTMAALRRLTKACRGTASAC